MSQLLKILMISILISAGGLTSLPGYTQNPFEDQIIQFENSDKEAFPEPGGVLFVGSSSIRMWTGLETDFEGHPVLNRGFGGSQTSDVIYFFHRIVAPYKPAKIVLYEGDNDIASGKAPDEVLKDFETLVQLVRENIDEAEIAFVAIKPSPSRFHLLDKVSLTNRKVEELCLENNDLNFIDIFEPMIGEDGRPIPGLFLKDSLHMSEAGYRIWTSQIMPFLEK